MGGFYITIYSQKSRATLHILDGALGSVNRVAGLLEQSKNQGTCITCVAFEQLRKQILAVQKGPLMENMVGTFDGTASGSKGEIHNSGCS